MPVKWNPLAQRQNKWGEEDPCCHDDLFVNFQVLLASLCLNKDAGLDALWGSSAGLS